MKRLIQKISSTLLLMTVIIPAMAQGAPPATPIDGGLSLLLAAGGIYGVKKMMDKK
jgi:hypothetical protein